MDIFEGLPKEIVAYGVTSVLGSAIGVILGFFWREKIIPFIGDLSEGTVIYPEWKGRIILNPDKIWDATFTIKKDGKKISGQLHLLTGESAGKKYTVKGRFDYGMLHVCTIQWTKKV